MRRFTVTLLLLLLLIPNSKATTDSYLVSISRMGRVENQFCAQLSGDNGNYLLTSEAHKDIVLVRLEPGLPISNGKYSVTFQHQNRKTTTIPMTASQHGESISFVSKTPVDFRLELRDCLGETPRSDGWSSPFAKNDGAGLAAFKGRIVGKFGDFRTAGGDNGHRHAGVDLKGSFGEAVYPISSGRIIAISFKDLSGGVVIEHLLPDGEKVYSKYVHIQDIPVKVGEQVSTQTRIGRLFDKISFKKSRYKHNHLHLEIRKDYADKGTDSSYSQSRKDLERHCFDPALFMREHLSTLNPTDERDAKNSAK